jgi:Zn-dependent peptidase ImmA (M78 family)
VARSPAAQAQRLLKSAGITQPPIAVERIAASLGVQVALQPLEADVSGMLYRHEQRALIGVNASESHTRRRFTIAHELGHHQLHEGRPLIVDKIVRVNLRAPKTTPSDTEEREANQFAAELLMPGDMVKAAVVEFVGDRDVVSDRQLVRRLAEMFDVSQQAMEYRLVNLHFLSRMALEG